jgi:hypothetical protein
MATLPPNDLKILRLAHQSQSSEFSEQRGSVFNIFAWWTTALLALIAAVVVFHSGTGKSVDFELILAMAISVSIVSAITIVFMCRKRMFASRALDIIIDIEEHLGLFEKDRYIQDKPVYPKNLPHRQGPQPPTTDRIQIIAVALLTILFWIVSWKLIP